MPDAEGALPVADKPTAPAPGLLQGITATVIGGDGRELEILKGLIAEGAAARACGCPPGATAITSRPQSPTLAAAIAGADVIVAPVPLIDAERALFAPQWPERLYLDEHAFEGVKPGALLVIGTSKPYLDELARRRGFRIREYGEDDELMILRAPTIGEGAIGMTIAHTEISIHASQTVVVGFGRMGFTMTRLLVAMGAHVTVVARNPVQRARAWELGARVLTLEQLPDAVSNADMVFNTVPTLLLTRDIMTRMRREVFVLDIAGTPGGTDFAAATELGINAMLGRGLGSRAPKTAGQSQWRGVRKILLAEIGRAG